MTNASRFFSAGIIYLILGLTGALGLTTPLLAQGAGGMPSDLQALINEALTANPDVKQRAELKTAAEEAIRPAGALDNPQLSFGLLNIPVNTWSFKQEPMTMKEVGLSQKLPFPGKLRLRSEIAADMARTEGYTYQDKVNEIRSLMIQRYWILALTYSGYDITARNKQFWEQVVQVSETRYGVGQGRQSDVLQAQVELGNYLNRLLQWRQEQESVAAGINALRSQPPQTPVPRPQPLKSRPVNLKLEELLALAKERPQVKALQAQIDQQEKAVALARKEYYPDFNVGVAYGQRDNLGPPTNMYQPDFFSSQVMVDLPIWRGSKIQPRIREQLARLAAAKEAYRSVWDQLAASIQDRLVKLQRLSHQITLYQQGIIPQAQQAAAAALSDYSVGLTDFARMYQNEIGAYNAELTLQELLRDVEQTWAELEWLVGAELPRRPGDKK